MPTDVKATVSAVVIFVALGLIYWSGSPIQPDLTSSCYSPPFFSWWRCGYSRKPE